MDPGFESKLQIGIKYLFVWRMGTMILWDVYMTRISQEDQLNHGHEIIEGMMGEFLELVIDDMNIKLGAKE